MAPGRWEPESLAGADEPPGGERAADRWPRRFSRALACQIAGLDQEMLARWEQAAVEAGAPPLASGFSFPDVLAFAVLRDLSDRLGDNLDAFTVGLVRLFAALTERGDVERLDGHVALVGRDFARVAELRGGHVRCVGGDFAVIPLGPILKELRDRVLS